MNLTLPELTRDELFLLLVGLERLRDDNAREARRYRDVGPSWRSPEFAEELAREREQDSHAAETLREKLKRTKGYREEEG